MKCSYLSQHFLQDDGECLKSAVTGCQESFELLDALVLPLILGNIRWYHIRRSAALVSVGMVASEGFAGGTGLGFVLVHCERTCVECRDNVDHHHTPLHNCCSWSNSSTTHPIHSRQGHRCSKLCCQSSGYVCSPELFCQPV